jgi:hypothetical protein
LLSLLALLCIGCSQTGGHLQQNLAKFDYAPDMKVETKFINFGYLLEPVVGIW